MTDITNYKIKVSAGRATIELKELIFNDNNKDGVYHSLRSVQPNVYHKFGENNQPQMIVPSDNGNIIVEIGDHIIYNENSIINVSKDGSYFQQFAAENTFATDAKDGTYDGNMFGRLIKQGTYDNIEWENHPVYEPERLIGNRDYRPFLGTPQPIETESEMTCDSSTFSHANFIRTIVANQLDIPTKFKEWRKQRGLTLRNVESVTGISNAYLSQLETGKVKNPSFEVVVKLCQQYKIQLTIKP